MINITTDLDPLLLQPLRVQDTHKYHTAWSSAVHNVYD